LKKENTEKHKKLKQTLCKMSISPVTEKTHSGTLCCKR